MLCIFCCVNGTNGWRSALCILTDINLFTPQSWTTLNGHHSQGINSYLPFKIKAVLLHSILVRILFYVISNKFVCAQKQQEWFKEVLYIFYLNSPLFSILLICFIFLILPSLPHSYTYTQIFFLNSLMHWTRRILLPLHNLFPRYKNIPLCNHSAFQM